MPQKTRSQKERAAARRETQVKGSVAPAPIEMESEITDSGLNINVPAAPQRRAANAVAMPQNATAEFDYSYVYSDLRRIALLAVLCLGIMTALAFALR